MFFSTAAKSIVVVKKSADNFELFLIFEMNLFAFKRFNESQVLNRFLVHSNGQCKILQDPIILKCHIVRSSKSTC